MSEFSKQRVPRPDLSVLTLLRGEHRVVRNAQQLADLAAAIDLLKPELILDFVGCVSMQRQIVGDRFQLAVALNVHLILLLLSEEVLFYQVSAKWFAAVGRPVQQRSTQMTFGKLATAKQDGRECEVAILLRRRVWAVAPISISGRQRSLESNRRIHAGNGWCGF